MDARVKYAGYKSKTYFMNDYFMKKMILHIQSAAGTDHLACNVRTHVTGKK